MSLGPRKGALIYLVLLALTGEVGRGRFSSGAELRFLRCCRVIALGDEGGRVAVVVVVLVVFVVCPEREGSLQTRIRSPNGPEERGRAVRGGCRFFGIVGIAALATEKTPATEASLAALAGILADTGAIASIEAIVIVIVIVDVVIVDEVEVAVPGFVCSRIITLDLSGRPESHGDVCAPLERLSGNGVPPSSRGGWSP